MAVAEGKKAGVVVAKVSAQKTVSALRKGIEAIPIDLDPRVATLIAAREVAKGTLEAAKELVKGVGNATKLLAAGVDAVGKADVFVLEKSNIQGSLTGGLKGEPVVLDMNFKIRGKSFKNRLGFSLTDAKYNAKQFEVIALGAGVKAVIAKAQKAKIVPHVLLDRVAKLYLERQAEADEEAKKAVDSNGEVETDLNDGTLSVGNSIDQNTRHRRELQEADRKHRIAMQEKAQQSYEERHRAELELLLSETGKWGKLTGRAMDIGASLNGSVWIVGTNGKPYRWVGKNWEKMPGSAVRRIDVGPNGIPWIVNKHSHIFRYIPKKKAWKQVKGLAIDIGVGANGQVWVIGTDEKQGGFGIYRRDGNKWTRMPGAAVRIDVGHDGTAWVVNDRHRIFRFDKKKNNWVKLPGRAYEIAVSPTGVVMVVGLDRKPWVWDGEAWHRLSGSHLVNLTLDRNGLPLATTHKKNHIWAMGKANPPPPAFFGSLKQGKILAKLRKKLRRHEILMNQIMHHAERAALEEMFRRR